MVRECPVCKTKIPFMRMPTSFKQAFKGGWTCEKCGVELDKHVKIIGENDKEIKKLK